MSQGNPYLGGGVPYVPGGGVRATYVPVQAPATMTYGMPMAVGGGMAMTPNYGSGGAPMMMMSGPMMVPSGGGMVMGQQVPMMAPVPMMGGPVPMAYNGGAPPMMGYGGGVPTYAGVPVGVAAAYAPRSQPLSGGMLHSSAHTPPGSVGRSVEDYAAALDSGRNRSNTPTTYGETAAKASPQLSSSVGGVSSSSEFGGGGGSLGSSSGADVGSLSAVELVDPTRQVLFKLKKTARAQFQGLQPALGGLGGVSVLHPQFSEYLALTKRHLTVRVLEMIQKKLEPRGLLEQSSLRPADMHLGRLLSLNTLMGSLQSESAAILGTGKGRPSFKAFLETSLGMLRSFGQLIKKAGALLAAGGSALNAHGNTTNHTNNNSQGKGEDGVQCIRSPLVKKAGYPAELFGEESGSGGASEMLVTHTAFVCALFVSVLADLYSQILGEAYLTVAGKKFDKLSPDEQVKRFVSKSNSLDPCGLLMFKFDYPLLLAATEARLQVDAGYTLARNAWACSCLRLPLYPILSRTMARHLSLRLGRSWEGGGASEGSLTPAEMAALTELEALYVGEAAQLEAQRTDDSSSMCIGRMQSEGLLTALRLPFDQMGAFVDRWIPRLQKGASAPDASDDPNKLVFSEYNAGAAVRTAEKTTFSEYTVPVHVTALRASGLSSSDGGGEGGGGGGGDKRTVFSEYQIPAGVVTSASGAGGHNSHPPNLGGGGKPVFSEYTLPPSVVNAKAGSSKSPDHQASLPLFSEYTVPRESVHAGVVPGDSSSSSPVSEKPLSEKPLASSSNRYISSGSYFFTGDEGASVEESSTVSSSSKEKGKDKDKDKEKEKEKEKEKDKDKDKEKEKEKDKDKEKGGTKANRAAKNGSLRKASEVSEKDDKKKEKERKKEAKADAKRDALAAKKEKEKSGTKKI